MAYDTDLVERLREVLATDLAEGKVRERAMFGGRAFFVNGNLAVSASSRGGLMARADPDDVGTLLDEPHTETFHMHGRTMKNWVHVDVAGVRTKAQLKRWAGIGLGYARSLPAK